MVERNLAKVDVAGSSPVSRSSIDSVNRRHSQAVRQRFAKPSSPGSNPGVASILLCRSGEIGRHKGLKIPRVQARAGSSPASGTNNSSGNSSVVERNLAKVDVAGSSPVSRSIFYYQFIDGNPTFNSCVQHEI